MDNGAEYIHKTYAVLKIKLPTKILTRGHDIASRGSQTSCRLACQKQDRHVEKNMVIVKEKWLSETVDIKHPESKLTTIKINSVPTNNIINLIDKSI